MNTTAREHLGLAVSAALGTKGLDVEAGPLLDAGIGMAFSLDTAAHVGSMLGIYYNLVQVAPMDDGYRQQLLESLNSMTAKIMTEISLHSGLEPLAVIAASEKMVQQAVAGAEAATSTQH